MKEQTKISQYNQLHGGGQVQIARKTQTKNLMANWLKIVHRPLRMSSWMLVEMLKQWWLTQD